MDKGGSAVGAQQVFRLRSVHGSAMFRITGGIKMTTVSPNSPNALLPTGRGPPLTLQSCHLLAFGVGAS